MAHPYPTSASPGQRARGRLRVAVASRLSDEGGFALILAVGILLVLSITVASVISYTGAGSRGASLDASGQRAYAVAEAGLNNALSVLTKTGTDSTAVGAQPQYAGDTNSSVTTYQGGDTATWGASYNSSTRTWTIKSIGSTANPTGPAASAVTRTVYGTATIQAPPYTFVSLDNSCDNHELVIRSSGQLYVANNIYTNSCNGGDGFDVFGTGGSIAAPEIRTVGGWETHDGNDVIVNGVKCPLLSQFAPAVSTPAGCPLVSQAILADPFVNVAGPTPSGTGACTSPIYGAAASYTSLATKPKTVLAMAAGATDDTITFTTTNPGWIQNGDVIAIQNEFMLVTGGGGTASITATRGLNGTGVVSHASATEVKKVPVTTGGTAATPKECQVTTGTVTLQPGTYYGGICIGGTAGTDCTASNCVATPSYTFGSNIDTLNSALDDTSLTTVLTGSTTIVAGNVIRIESEWLLVQSVVSGGSGKTLTSTLTFTQRGYGGTTPAAHASGKNIQKGTPVSGAPVVTMAPGTYIMAGGGFRVCGLAGLSAPNVLIYNTNDATSPTGLGALDQIMLNTFGIVQIGPQVVGRYAGLTMFQDRALSLGPTAKCDNRALNLTDIALVQMASTGANGKLGSISGTIYGPGPKMLFSDYVGGTANLAVITGCILIDGGDATFDFQLSGLFGVGLALQKVWG